MIKLHPPIPKSIKVEQIQLNANGSKAALISEKSVFIVNISEDFWAYSSVVDSVDFNAFLPEYISEYIF